MGVYKKGGKWYIDYYIRGERKRKMIGPSKEMAKLVLKDIQVKIAKGEYLGIYEEKKILFKDFAKEYLTYSKTNKSGGTYQKDKMYVFAHFVPCFGKEYLFNITTKIVEDYKSMRREKVKPSTVNKELSVLKAMFNRAIEWGYLKKNPTASVRKLKEALPFPRFLSHEEVEALLVTCSSSHIYPIIVVALNTGMRKSELLNLEWKDIDFENQNIRVDNKGNYHVKNYEPRLIPMNQEVYDTLRMIPRHPTSSYVFCDKQGNKYGDVKKAFKAALRRAGIGNFRFHDLRHSFASHLVMNGCNLRAVQQLLGHKDIKMTMRYSHLSKDHLKGAVENIYYRHYLDTNAEQAEPISSRSQSYQVPP
jgi:integrase